MRLTEALRGVLRESDEVLAGLARVLYTSLGRAVTRREVVELVGGDAEELLLVASEYRLLLSDYDAMWVRHCVPGGEGERYVMPLVVEEAVRLACEAGRWRGGEAIRRCFERLGEPLSDRLPSVFERLKGVAGESRRVSAFEIREVAESFGFEPGTLIAELKASGLITPRPPPPTAAKKLIYELHPLF
ncbi:MAG: hypothetical protein ACXQTZ_02765 [Candidatus Alkanophagales archaeon]